MMMDQKIGPISLTKLLETLNVASNGDDEAMAAKKSLLESIGVDDRAEFIARAKKLCELGGGGNRRLDRSAASNLLQLCCASDSAECAAVLISGEIGAVPLLNEMDGETGLSPLHTAAEAHSSRCVELLLRKHARTDSKSKNGRYHLPLELSLFTKRLDSAWNPNDSIESLIYFLREKNLSTVRLLAEKTKEAAKVAYRCAMEGRVISLGAMLMVAAATINESILEVRTDADLGTKEKVTIYDCVVREALSLGRTITKPPPIAENSEKRKALLREIELLQAFGAGAAAHGGSNRKAVSLLLGASQALDEDVIKLVLNTSVDVNGADSSGNTALHWAIKTTKSSDARQIRIVWLLLRHGVRVSQRDNFGLTAVHNAAANGNKQALQILLLEDPTSVHVTTESKETPLFFAVKNDSMACTELLLQWGAHSEVLNLRKQRPVDLATSQDMRFMLRSTNVGLRSYSFEKQKNTLHNNELVSESCEVLLSMPDEDGNDERSSLKTAGCRYFGSRGGCFRGVKCNFGHGKENLQQLKNQGMPVAYSVGKDFERKIFVGGLPPSLESESLGKFFEEHFGPVEHAIVIGEKGNEKQSRGFGFVKFKNQQSVYDAVEAHYVSILGKIVEIKTNDPKNKVLAEQKKQSSQKQHDNVTLGHQLQVPSHDGKKCSTSVDMSMPLWFQAFKEWFPGFILQRMRIGQPYSLSSLKQDFRVHCGLEMNHASLGYLKLSDFVNSFSGVFRMEVVPIGARGFASHVVLLPNQPCSHPHSIPPIKMPCTASSSEPGEYSCIGYASPDSSVGEAAVSHSDIDHLDGFESVQDLPSVSNDNVDLHQSSLNEGNPLRAVPQVNPHSKGINDTAVKSLLASLELDPPLLSQSLTSKTGNMNKRGDEVCKKEHESRLPLRDSVFNTPAMRNTASAIFLQQVEYKAADFSNHKFPQTDAKACREEFPPLEHSKMSYKYS